MQETWVRSLGREDPLEKEMATTSVFLPGKSTCLYPQLLPILLICCMVREAHSDHHIFIII